MSPDSAKALIMVVSRPEAVEVAVEKLEPEHIGVIMSQNIAEKVIQSCASLRHSAAFSYRFVDSPMEIGHSFERFEHLLGELEGLCYGVDEVILDATGGTTPMRLGAALAAITRGIPMVHQQVPQIYANG